jgi:hypothetical protein
LHLRMSPQLLQEGVGRCSQAPYDCTAAGTHSYLPASPISLKIRSLLSSALWSANPHVRTGLSQTVPLHQMHHHNVHNLDLFLDNKNRNDVAAALI